MSYEQRFACFFFYNKSWRVSELIRLILNTCAVASILPFSLTQVLIDWALLQHILPGRIASHLLLLNLLCLVNGSTIWLKYVDIHTLFLCQFYLISDFPDVLKLIILTLIRLPWNSPPGPLVRWRLNRFWSNMLYLSFFPLSILIISNAIRFPTLGHLKDVVFLTMFATQQTNWMGFLHIG